MWFWGKWRHGIRCLSLCMDGEGLGSGCLGPGWFLSLAPFQPGYPVIPLTNWHLINPNELFSNFIIQHQELMRESLGWWWEPRTEVGCLKDEGAVVTS